MGESLNSFASKSELKVGNKNYTIFRIANLNNVSRLPFSLKILLENLLRYEDGKNVKKADIEAFFNWDPKKKPDKEIAFRPARVLLQDFTGVPCVVDLAAMRDAMKKMGKDPKKINPLQPVDLVIDHSVQVDYFGTENSFEQNSKIEFERNQERYQFLRWGQSALRNFSVVPPETGIVHQVNLEYLAKVVMTGPGLDSRPGPNFAYPDTLVGTDSHTTMINGLGVVGWGVGGIEAEAAMLGQPISMLIPEVIGFKLTGALREGTTATDLVLTVTQMLRKKGVVDKFVEFYGPGLSNLPLTDRATIANMAPEYGATIGFFPVDQETLAYLKLSNRPKELVDLVESYAKEQGLFRANETPDPIFTDTLELDLSTVEPSLAGPKRPQDRVALGKSKHEFRKVLCDMVSGKTNGVNPERIQQWIGEGGSAAAPDPSIMQHLGHIGTKSAVELNGNKFDVKHGSVVIAAITSCTNTSNPAVMIGAGLVAKKAVERGLTVKPWVKTSLAPGSKVVMDYLDKTGLTPFLEKLKFNLVGFGCTTCIGNSGPLPEPIGKAIKQDDLVAVAVLSGNRNFEGRVHPLVRANYLASPPLVVAYALAGTADINLETEPIANDSKGKPVFLKDIWPSQKEVNEALRAVDSEMFKRQYADVFKGDEMWRTLKVPTGDTFVWEPNSTYVKNPPYFIDMPAQPAPLKDIKGARLLALLGDSVTTDHISPAGSIPEDSPAGKYLIAHGVTKKDFNSYGARRGNHEVMIRGTFANIRLRNQLAPGTEGGFTKHFPDGKVTTIFEASEQYTKENIPLIVIAGKEYGSGSSRDWAAKGPALLGVRAVIAQSYERIHRSNLIGMGVLPLQFQAGETPESLGLKGDEIFDIDGISDNLTPGKILTVKAGSKSFKAICRIQTPEELNYYRNGGILQYVLRQLV